MDYDDNEFQGQNRQLAGEGCSKVSPVLRSYALPKFDFDDSLPGHLRFDSLVENEVFLGITSQEDNQWIEEYSRGNSGIDFGSGTVESRRKNVWSEATSSESVEMLLKSVGQEERIVKETISKQLDICDEPGSGRLTKIMDPNLNQDDGKEHVTHAQNASVQNEFSGNFPGFVSSGYEQSHFRFTSQSRKAQISIGDLDSVVMTEKQNLSVSDEKVDSKCDDVIQKKAKISTTESMDKELQEYRDVSRVEFKNLGGSESVDASIKDSIKRGENGLDIPMDSGTMIVESCIYSEEKSLNVVSNVETVENSSVDTSIRFSDEPASLLPTASSDLQIAEGCVAVVCSTEPSEDSKSAATASLICSAVDQDLKDNMHEEPLLASENDGNFELQSVQDGNTKLENPISPESKEGSLSKIFETQISSVQETEFALGKDACQVTADASVVPAGGGSSFNQVETSLTATCLPDDLLSGKVKNEDATAGNNALEDSDDKDGCLPAKSSVSMQVDYEVRSSEPGAICMDQDVSFNETGNAGLHLASSDVDIEVGDLDSQKNIESSLSAEGSKEKTVIAHNFESDVSIQAEQGALLLSGSVTTADIVADDQPKSPILGVSLVHEDDNEKAEGGLLDEGHSQSETPQVESVVDSASKSLSLVEKAVPPDLLDKTVHGIAVHCATQVERCDAGPSEQAAETNTGGQDCVKTFEMSPRELSENRGEKSEAGLMDPKDSMTEVDFAVNKSNEHQTSADVALPSEFDANNIGQDGGSVSSTSKPQPDFPSHISSMELSQSAKDKQDLTKGVTLDNSPSKVADDVEGNVQSVSTSSATQEEKSFTFEVGKTANLGHAEGFQYPTFQAANMPTIPEGSSIYSSSSQVGAKKLHEVSLVSPQNSSDVTTQVGVKGKSERKTRLKSVGKESARKANEKDTTPAKDSGRVEKATVSLTPPATGQGIQFEEVKLHESVTKPSGVRAFSSPKLPDLNNSTTIFQQPFTDNQQVQLRAQILVYGSLISGTPPEEPHMIAAFGQSDDGRGTWEGVWRACLERHHAQKSQANCDTPMQSRSDVRDAGNRADQGTKHASVQNKIPASPIAGASSKGTPPIVNPMIPLSSPLWNISTPCDGLQSSGMARTARLDYLQALSPLHPYQTSAVQNFSGHNPSWLSQGPFAGPWVSSSPIPAFNTGPRFSSLPITEAVKLNPVKESGGPGIKQTSTSVAPSIFPVTSLSDINKVTASSGQPSSDSKSRKRKKVTASVNVNQIFNPSLTQIASVSAPVIIHLPQAPPTEDHGKISLLTQNQTGSVTTPVSSPFTTQVTTSTPAFFTTKSSPKLLPAVSPTSRDHHRSGDQNREKAVILEETLNEVQESKLQSRDAADLAAAAVSHCQGVWSQLGRQNNSGLNSDDEAKLVSSAISIAAAASVAKVAAAAAKIASNVAEQAKSMVDNFLSNKSESFDQSSTILFVNKFDKSSHAREAAWQRAEAASTSSKHAENLGAIVKAAELAAEAVSQAGNIVAMGDPLPLRDLVEAGPEGYWKTPWLESKRQAVVAGNLNSSSNKKNVEAAPNVPDKEILTTKSGLPGKENSGDLAKDHMEVDGISVPVISHEKDTRKPTVNKGPDSSKTIGVTSETEIGSIGVTSIVDQSKPKVTSDTLKHNSIKEGCLVEVYKYDDKYRGAWFGANVLSLKDGKALVCYTEIQSDGGHLKEWVPLEVEGTKAPRIRVAHPVTSIRLEGTRKRRRTAVTDFLWSSGDRVDVWMQNCWREGAVVETNKIDVTSLTVRFQGQGETSVVRSWHVRPTLIWKDSKWISEGRLSSQGDTPQEKRLKLGSPVVESKRNDGSLENVDLVVLRKQEESRTLPLSTQESLFNVGSSRDNNKIGTRRTMRSGLQKEGPRVIFGVPKPGKKQKFMEVSKHYVADGSYKNNKSHDSVKFTRYLIPQPPGSRGSKNNSRTDAKEKQAPETKPRVLKSRKPPIPSIRTFTSSRSMTRDAVITNKIARDSVSDDENQSGHQNQMEFGSSSNTEDPTGHADIVSKQEVPADLPKRVFTSSTKSERLNKRKFAPAGEKATKDEKSLLEHVEPRRSNRKIQPTSRLLEGLQSSMTISKIPAASHSSQRSHSKVSPKGNSKNG